MSSVLSVRALIEETAEIKSNQMVVFEERGNSPEYPEKKTVGSG